MTNPLTPIRRWLRERKAARMQREYARIVADWDSCDARFGHTSALYSGIDRQINRHIALESVRKQFNDPRWTPNP